MLSQNITEQELVSRWGSRTLPPEPRHRSLKFYHPYTQFPRNVRLCHRRVLSFSVQWGRIVTSLIVAPYKYSDLLTDQFLVDNCPCTYLLISFLLTTAHALTYWSVSCWQLPMPVLWNKLQTTWWKKTLFEGLECYKDGYSNESLWRCKTNH